MFDGLLGPPSEQEKKRLAQIRVSWQEEREVGDAVTRDLLNTLKQRSIQVHRRGRDLRYLHDLVDSIHPQMRNGQRYKRVDLYLADSPLCEARSLPGGTLVFFRGLLQSCDSEAALVGVVGHELSHLDRGHHLDRIRRVKLAQQMFAPQRGKRSLDQFFRSGTTVLRMWTRPFHPEQEMEADRDGALWAYRSGYDPREMAKLLRKLDRQPPPAFMPKFLRSHPAPLDRYRAVMQQTKQLQQSQPNSELYVGRENLRRRVARSRKRFAN